MEPTEEKGDETSPLKQIRTFEGDMAEAIKRQNESLVSIQRAEATRQEARVLNADEVGELESGGGKRALFYAILTLVLAGIGGLGAYYAYNTYKVRTAPPIVSTPANQFIGAATISRADASTLSRQALLGVMAIERSRERGATAITHVQLTRGTEPTAEFLSSQDFLTRLNVHAPQSLVRALNPLFMLGVLGSNPAHAFSIIQVDSFQHAFPGMLEWEPRLAEDLLAMFADEAVIENVPTASSWQDLVIQNRDVRILKDRDGKTVMLYGFFENRLLIITDNEASFRTIAERLESQKLER